MPPRCTPASRPAVTTRWTCYGSLSSLFTPWRKSVIGAQLRDAGEGRVDCLTPCPNRDAAMCHHIEIHFMRRPHLRMHCEELKSILMRS